MKTLYTGQRTNDNSASENRTETTRLKIRAEKQTRTDRGWKQHKEKQLPYEAAQTKTIQLLSLHAITEGEEKYLQALSVELECGVIARDHRGRGQYLQALCIELECVVIARDHRGRGAIFTSTVYRVRVWTLH